MSKVQNPVIGRATGQAGGMVFKRNFESNVMQAKPFQVKNPNTTAQVQYRTLFKTVSQICADFSVFDLKIIYNKNPVNKSRKSLLFKAIYAGHYLNGELVLFNFANVPQFGSGFDSAVKYEDQSAFGSVLSCYYTFTETQFSGPADRVAVLVFNPDLNQHALFLTSALNSEGTVDVNMPSNWSDATMYSMFFASTTDKVNDLDLYSKFKSY